MSNIHTRPATNEYRSGIDAMTCRHPGCKRWRAEYSQFCEKHTLFVEETRYAMFEELITRKKAP